MKFSVKVHKRTINMYTKIEDEKMFSLVATMIKRQIQLNFLPRWFSWKCGSKNIFGDV